MKNIRYRGTIIVFLEVGRSNNVWGKTLVSKYVIFARQVISETRLILYLKTTGVSCFILARVPLVSISKAEQL